MSTFQLVDWNEDVVRKGTVGIDEEGKLLAHLQTSDEWFFVSLQNFDDLSVNLVGPAFLGKEADFHLVARQSMKGVVVIHAHPSTIRQINKVASTTGTGEHTFAHLRTTVVGEFTILVDHDVLTVNHLVEHIDAKHLQRMRREFQRLEELFGCEIISWVQAQVVTHGAAQFLLTDFRPRSRCFL